MSNILSASAGAPLTGGKVLTILLGFFGVVVGVNGLLIYDAVSTFRGEVVEHPFEAGLAYDRDIAAAEAQARRRWKVDVDLADGAVRATFHDAGGDPLTQLAVSGRLAAPADKQRDQTIVLSETTPGVYEGASHAPPGVWDLTLAARRGGDLLFQSNNRVTLR